MSRAELEVKAREQICPCYFFDTDWDALDDVTLHAIAENGMTPHYMDQIHRTQALEDFVWELTHCPAYENVA